MTLTTSLHKQLTFILSLVVSAFLFIVFTQTSHAATINVVAGTDAIEQNSQCQLSEAIQNINDQTQTNTDCPAGDGNNDTINLPSGTITLTANLPAITRSMAMQGQGMGLSIIDGDSAYRVFATYTINFGLRGLTLTGFKDDAVQAINTNIAVEQVEVDGASSIPVLSSLHGFEVAGMDGGNYEASFTDVYVHGFPALTSLVTVGINVGAVGGSSFSAAIENTTVADIAGDGPQGAVGIIFSTGLTNNELSTGSVTATLTNSTITNITSQTSASGLVAGSAVNNGQGNVQVDVNNTTISDVDGQVSSRGVVSAGSAFGANDEVSAAIDLTNVIVSSLCGTDVMILGPTPAGTHNLDITSSGGNISDDNTCGDSFTHPTDQNNVDAADLHLGTLGDYGGSVPTIPLGQGSIAIDAGVTVPGLTTDARGVSRPQCSAYDSGAYEYNGTCPSTEDNDAIPTTTEDAAPNAGDGNNDGIPDSEQSNVTSLPSTDGTYVTLEAPEGVVINTTTITAATTLTTQDIAYAYPLGLVSFTATTTNGTTVPIALYFYTDTNAATFTARKYNTNTNGYFTIPEAILTDITIANKHVVKLTYQITDGGILDQDNTTNGTIVDPVGLAQTTTTAPDTGLGKYWLLTTNR